MSEDTTQRPLVDVGIPTRERPDLVCEAIESVVAQTLPDWRLLVSENGPCGGETEEAVGPYLSDPRVNYSCTGTDVGGPENWTRLIRRGDAPYVALLHDDDLWEPGFLERRVTFLEAHPECAFVFSSNKEIDTDGRVTGQAPLVLPEGVHPPQAFFPVLYRHNVIGVPTIVVRRTAYEAVGARFESGTWPFWDYEMWLKIAARFPIAYLPVADCSYRMHRVRMTLTVRHFGRGYMQILDCAEALLAEHPELHVDSRLRRRRRAQALLIMALDHLEDGDRRAGWRRLREAIRIYPRAVFDVRFPTGVAALIGGKLGLRALTRARYFVRLHDVRFHRR